MSYKIKTQRQAAERRQLELELRLTKMCIDFGNFVLQSREKSGNFSEVTLEDVRDVNKGKAAN